VSFTVQIALVNALSDALEAKDTFVEKIRLGVQHFRTIVFPQMREMHERLAEKQIPDALFITCGDSRIDPSLLTGTDPGEIFVERTPGNIVPIYDIDVGVGVSASIEYAVEVFGVKNIIVCGHSACGAMRALLHPEHLQLLPATARWLKFAQPALKEFRRENTNKAENLNRLTQINVQEQLKHLHTHPAVEQRFKTGSLGLHGWMYEIHTGIVKAYNPATRVFELV
jgi:carbonic anhydrase